MPLLWNMIKVLIIKSRLSSSLPNKAHEYFSLSMDAVAGTVSVSVGYFGLEFEGLTKSISPAHPCGDHVDYKFPQYLNESWMALFKCGICPRILECAEPQRFLFYSDLRTARVGLQSQWNTFVYLALALGVDPYEKEFLELRNDTAVLVNKRLRSRMGPTLINVSKKMTVYLQAWKSLVRASQS